MSSCSPSTKSTFIRISCNDEPAELLSTFRIHSCILMMEQISSAMEALIAMSYQVPSRSDGSSPQFQNAGSSISLMGTNLILGIITSSYAGG